MLLTHVFGRHGELAPGSSRAGLIATRRLLPSLRPSRYIHVPASDRFDEILYLVETASNLTLSETWRGARVSLATLRKYIWP
jgi:hypothetical protein